MNRLQLKTLLLSVITEIKFDQPLAPNAIHIKNQFRSMVGLPRNSTNISIINEMQRVYTENNLLEDFINTMIKFKLDHLLLDLDFTNDF